MQIRLSVSWSPKHRVGHDRFDESVSLRHSLLWRSMDFPGLESESNYPAAVLRVTLSDMVDVSLSGISATMT